MKDSFTKVEVILPFSKPINKILTNSYQGHDDAANEMVRNAPKRL
jgi:hypothetical protein